MALLLQYTLIFASVLMLVALGGCFAERSGIINIGLEGIMVIGALGGALAMKFIPVSVGAPVMILATIGFGLAVSGMYATGLGNAGVVFNRYPIALGFFMFFTGLGSIFFPSIVGAVADLTNIRTGMLVLLLPLALQLVCAIANLSVSKQDTV